MNYIVLVFGYLKTRQLAPAIIYTGFDKTVTTGKFTPSSHYQELLSQKSIKMIHLCFFYIKTLIKCELISCFFYRHKKLLKANPLAQI